MPPVSTDYNPAVIYCFGRFVFDYEARQLLVDGGEIHLSPKAFELLAILLAERSRAVSKGELLNRLWPSTFVEETNLASLVAEIRRAVHDSAIDPAFVRTVHRFGYRFIGEVTGSGTELSTRPSQPRPCLIFDDRPLLLMEGPNVIGRAPDATIQCLGAGVSRYHARIVVSADGVTVEDLNSKNGTYVRNERIASARLSDGDEIRLGAACLTFRIKPPVEATETVVPDSRPGPNGKASRAPSSAPPASRGRQ